ncbi:MAG: hypothetical protein HFJ42_09325 [Clostridia bacterium]|nr:hypothetical protein [Clostridia bacterium]
MKYVIKIGTSSLFNEDGTAKENVLKDLLETVRKIFDEGHDVVIVISGAVACGKAILKQIVEKLEKEGKTENNTLYIEYKKMQEKIDFSRKLREKVDEFEKTGNTVNNLLYIKCKELLEKANLTTAEKSIIAGVGQTEMMRIIQNEAFAYGILTEQMLLSGRTDLKRSIAVKNIKKCFEKRILAVINANDTVYEEELADEGNERFSDNDTLAADLARAIKADRLFLITNVEGYLDSNNEVVREITVDKGSDYLRRTKLTKSVVGSGGMYSKLGNALTFAKTGGITFIISAKNISHILEIGELKRNVGTRVCKNLTLRERVKSIVKNNIENGGILNNGSSNRQATER